MALSTLATVVAQEDGAARGLEAFHKQLPLAALRGERVEWKLADPPQRSATRKVANMLMWGTCSQPAATELNKYRTDSHPAAASHVPSQPCCMCGSPKIFRDPMNL